MKSLVALFGRVCLSLIFVLSAINMMMSWEGTESLVANAMTETVNFLQPGGELHSMMGMLLPLSHLLLLVAVFFQIFGGLLVFFGVKVRFGAFLLLLFLLPATFFCHHFWWLQGADRELQMIMFLKNLSIFGGLLILLAYGKGDLPVKKPESASK